MSGRILLEMFGHIMFSFTRGVAEHYNPDEPEFTPELFGYNAFERTGREWNFFPVDELIYQEYTDRQDTTLDYLAASGFRVRINDACLPNENQEIQESQPLVEADAAMAWKRLRPSVLATVYALYRLALQIFQISHSKLSTLQTLPCNTIFLISGIWQVYLIVNHLRALSNGRWVHLFLKMILPSILTFVLGFLITTFIYPWYNNANDKGKYLIALFSPLTGVIFKVISRICVQRLWNITHPGYSYVLLIPWYFGVAINFRVLQADLDSRESIATIGIIHGSAEVIERSAIVFIDHICHMIWKRSSAPWGHFRTPRRERLMADIVIISMLYEAAAIVCVNSVWFLYQWVYIEGDFPLHLFVEFALRTSIALVIEWVFSSVSLTIVTRYQNMAAMAVWRKRWKRHILVALVNTVPLALWLNKYLMQIMSRRFDDPKQSCKTPFT
ncbi:uncharacterized protein [Acropora muricata]|uniref:uncharacterized protein n=1 Tax=Acropora muricata TaxID=159855 RepID=UPI0034E5F320